ncbi:hypothetical protein ACJJTC_003842, partial [Scirpophaga incertulas]
MTAALQIVGTKHVIPHVASERLQPLEEFTPDLAVCLDSWVGTSKAVNSKLRLISMDGSRLEYPDLDNCPLEDYCMRRRRSTPYSSSEFFPGQVVYGPLGSLDNANWLHVTKEMKAARKHKMHDHKFTVEAVITESVSVHWQCRALSTHPNETGTPQQPKFLVEGEDLKKLKLLNVFEPCTLQVGDRNFLTIGPEDTFISKKQWRKQQSKYFRNIRKQTRPFKKPSKSETNSSDHMPSRPKKRASANRKLKSTDNEMEVDQGEDKLESLDAALKADANCPSIKIDPSGDTSLPMASNQEDTATEEKNDSGISQSHDCLCSPEPNREDSSLLNGDSKSEAALNDDDSDNWENTSSDGSDTDSGATWSSRCSSVASQRGKRSPQLAVRLLRGKRLKRAARRAPPLPPPRVADRVVVETLHTASVANVVWQDGTIEMGIPSTQLYPIHHLDGQECFPGDFVVSGAANVEDNQQQMKHREYGVVQRVDHHGRTALVHWYRTYTSTEDPVPQKLYESEMSVYDLKDHPDFQYRPGTVVIRVANFTGEDANCTAGQVIDNFPTGRVKVWWVDGHTSMCWPQDLYKVGEYDSDEGELWGSEGSASEDSWETQSSAHDASPRTPDATPSQQNPLNIPGVSIVYVNDPEFRNSRIEVPNSVGGVPRLLEPRVAAHIERGRVAMRRLEEMFAKHPTLQSQEIMRKLLNLYKDCRFLDRLMGTSFFHEDHFLGLLERVRERGATTPRAGERRVHEQLARLFATDEPHEAPAPEAMVVDEPTPADIQPMEIEGGTPKKVMHVNIDPVEPSSSDTNVNNDNAQPAENLTVEGSNVDGTARNVCYKLCSLIHSQLVKAHAEVSRRRPQELADFLNALMKKPKTTEEKLPYHFSVQYGVLVVSMADQEDKGNSKSADEEKEVTTASMEKPEADGAVTESAPLATAEASEMEGEAEATPVAVGPSEAPEGGEGFCVLESAPVTHRFHLSILQPSEPRSFYSAVKREIKLLKSDLPAGVWVRAFEDRIDLLSVMIAGPRKTPYEGGLFVFDVQLGGEYPRAPPLCHYHSYCSDRLNPNLYEDGK